MNQFPPAIAPEPGFPASPDRSNGATATIDSLRRELVEEESFFGDLWEVVRRRAGLIGLVTVAVVAIVGGVTVMTPAEYTASTLLLIDKTAPQVVDIEGVLGDSLNGSDKDFYETNDLAGSAEYEEKVKGMAASLKALMKEIGDPIYDRARVRQRRWFGGVQ